MVASLAGGRLLQDWDKLVAPVDFCGQIGLPGHEGVTKLSRPFKRHNQLCINLHVAQTGIKSVLDIGGHL